MREAVVTSEGVSPRALSGRLLPARGAAVWAGFAGILIGLALWSLAAGNLIEFLPSPTEVWDAFRDAVATSGFWQDMGVTLRRIVIAWVVSFSLGVAVGLVMARTWALETLWHPWVFVGLAVPAPVTILFSILALGLGESTGLIALCAVVTPYVVVPAYDGARALDRKLFEMASVYRLPASERLRHVILPQLAPIILTAARLGFAMAWKIVVLVEALASTDGIGQQLRAFFSANEPASVIAWTLSFTLVMVLVELLVFRTIDRRLFAWRQKATP